jgi:phenylacetate-CoA ligase
LLQIPGLSPNYRIVVTREATLDEAEVEVEVTESFLAAAGTDSLTGDLRQVRELRERAERQLREQIGCTIGVTLQAPGSVPRSEGGKLQRVLDRRASA